MLFGESDEDEGEAGAQILRHGAATEKKSALDVIYPAGHARTAISSSSDRHAAVP